jgi:hypothetical protein
MNTIDLDKETRPPGDWLPREGSEELVYLARGGRPRFVIVPLDEGDEEALAIRKNTKLMAYISECVERARKGPTKTLAQIRAEFGLPASDNGNNEGTLSPK